MAGVLLIACGGEAKRNHNTESTTRGANTTGISVGGLTANNTSGAVTTAVGSVGGSSGTGGWDDTSVGGSGGFGAAGGTGGCGPTAPQLGACYGVTRGASGEGGIGGEGPSPEIDECWSDDEYQDCSALFEGRVMRVDVSNNTFGCLNDMFGDLSRLNARGVYAVWVSDGEVDLNLMLGPLERPLELERGDDVAVHVEKRVYHSGFMQGSRLTLTKGSDLIAVLNHWLPVDDSTHVGEFEFERGAALCKNPEDSFTCTETWHELRVKLDDTSLSLAPYTHAGLGNYSIFVDENQSMADGGGCDSGDTTNFALFKLIVP